MSEDATPADKVYHCLDLFAGLGGFSQAFEESDRWSVTTVDFEEKFDPDIVADVNTLGPEDLPNPDLVVASPPCRDFSLACMDRKWDIDNARSPSYVPAWESISESVSLLFHTLYLIQELQPDYWMLENPRWGAMRQIIGEPAATVHYCQYGKEFKKPTGFWGEHPPMDFRTCPGKPPCDHLSNPSELNTFRDVTRTGDVENSAERAKVPAELSADILEATERVIENPPPEQATLGQSVAATDGGRDD